MEKIRNYLANVICAYYTLVREDWGYYEDHHGNEYDVHLDTDGEIVVEKR